MNPACNLPENEREAALKRFRGYLTPEEEDAVRGMFPQYLFFRNEYTDDGWNVSDGPVRLCTCTSCGKTFEAVRGFDRRGKLHHQECNCPECGARVEGIAVNKYGYGMPSLQGWVKTAVAYTTEDGVLLIEAGNARRTFTHDELRGVLDWYPCKRYLFRLDPEGGTAMEWEERVMTWAWCAEDKDVRWMPTKSITDPFPPNHMGWADYEGDYSIVGLSEAVAASGLRYCQILDFYEYEYGAKLYELKTARWMVKYLGWYVHHPQIEMAVKLGVPGAVCELIQDGRKNARILDWSARNPAGFLRMSREDAVTFRRAGFDFTDLKTFRRLAGRTGLGRYMSLVDQAGGTDNLLRIERCAAGIRVKTERAVRYIRSQLPQCAQYAPPISQIIRTWEDYLNMAGELQLDLTETTVAMPKDLKARHDAAAETIRHNADEAEKKKYGKRRRLLEKKFGFELNGLRILVPGSAREIVEEGKTLHHCVGGYAPRHITGSTTILFLRHARRPERSFLTIEMTERKGRAEIAQIHGYRNEGYELTGGKRGAPPEDKYAWFLGPWLEWVNDGSPRDRKGAPILKNQEGMAG
jgi:hypothetical protein